MGIFQITTFSHWNYFLAIERDLEVLSRYVEFTPDNYKAYSIEMARIILSAGSEIDVLLKAICNKASPGDAADSITKYKKVVKSKLPNMMVFQVDIPRWEIYITPWEPWQSIDVPEWWTAYNKVKHHRDDEYHLANLFNTLNAVAALYVAILYLYPLKAEKGLLLPTPSLLRPSIKDHTGFVNRGFESGVIYKL